MSNFSDIFPSITHLTVIGPVKLYHLRLPKLTHLSLVDAEPNLVNAVDHCVRLPLLERVDFRIRNLSSCSFFIRSIRLRGELDAIVGDLSHSTMCYIYHNHWMNRLRQIYGRDESKESVEIIVDVRSAIYKQYERSEISQIPEVP
jgi:hypothetical protein